MDTLKGFVYQETVGGTKSWNLAVEDPKNKNHTRIVRCKKMKVSRSRSIGYSHKRGGYYKFKAFRFNGMVEKVEILKNPVTSIMPSLPENLYSQIPIIELRKLKEWID